MEPLQIGDRIPDFTLPDQNGDILDIKTFLGKKNIVIFFYPQDGSFGCTRQACHFRDSSEAFYETDSVIIGISGQSVKSHKEFAESYNLGYPLLSDEGNHVRKLFGVPSKLLGIMPGRVTYEANKEGKIIHIFNSQTKVVRHVDEALKVALILKKSETSELKSI